MALLHILAFALHGTGHVNAFMHLCRRLTGSDEGTRGLRITFVCTKEMEESANRARDLLDVCSAAASEAIRIVAIGSCPSSADMATYVHKAPSLLQDYLLQLSEADLPHCILADTFISCVQDTAEKLSIPWGVFWTSNAISDVMQLYTPQLVEEGFIPVASCEHKDRVIDFLPGVPPMPASELALVFHPESLTKIYPHFSDMSRRFKQAEFVLCNTLEELEPEVVAAIRTQMKANYFCIGPCISLDLLDDTPAVAATNASSVACNLSSEEDKLCLEWLEEQQESSVVYVSFGSVSDIQEEQVLQVILGLENAGYPFLLVLRKDLSFFSTIFQDTRDRSSGKGLVVSWAPQLQVLSHPSVRGFFTHCGWNSTLEAICTGVPMLALPLAGEQNVNARQMVVKWNIGLELIKG